jgi:hypothetical protein
MNPIYDCASCKQPGMEFFYDKRYKHSICRQCFLTRREQAATALDADWFLANVPFEQLTEREKEMSGIANPEEFKRAKYENEHPDLDADKDSSSTKELRGK